MFFEERSFHFLEVFNHLLYGVGEDLEGPGLVFAFAAAPDHPEVVSLFVEGLFEVAEDILWGRRR